MKQKLLFLLTALLIQTVAWADALKNGDTFVVDNVTYMVGDAKNLTVYVGVGKEGQTAVNTSTESIVIPSSVTAPDGQTYKVRLISNYAFDGCSSLTSVILPNTVEEIRAYSFRNCSALKSVTLPANLKSFNGFDGFANCTNLTSITIPNTVTRIASGTFYGCSNLKSFNLPDSLIELESGSFTGTAWYEEQPDGIIYKDNVFFEVKGKNIEGELKIKDGTRLIAENACENCYGLTSVVIPSTVTHINEHAFSGCKNLVSINIPNSVISIGGNSFSYCHSLKSFRLPASVTSIRSKFLRFGDGFLSYCENLESIEVESGNTKFASPNNCNAILSYDGTTLEAGCKNTVIPNTVQNIRSNAFAGCLGLTTIEIPHSVIQLGDYSFSGCRNLKTVTLGKNISKCSSYGGEFSGCYNLTEIYSYIREPFDIKDNYFSESVYTNATIFIPKGTKDKYEATDGWKNFKTFVEREDLMIPLEVGEKFVVDGLNYIVTSTDPLEVQLGCIIQGISNRFYATDNKTAQTLTSVEIPASVVGSDGRTYTVASLSTYAFNNCSNLTEIHSKMKAPHPISSAAFANAVYENATLYIPVGSNAFYSGDTYGWGKFKNIVFEGENIENSLAVGETFTVDGITYCVTAPFEVMVGDGDTNNNGVAHAADASISGDFEIPAAVTGPDGYQYTVTSIQRSAFYNCNDLTSIKLPSTIASIGAFAFSHCSGLTSFTIPKHVIYIDANPLAYCSGLKSIVVESGNAYYNSDGNCNAILYKDFRLVSGCQTTVIPSGVKYFDQWSFAGITGLTSFSFHEGTETIGFNMFTGCTNLASVKLSNSIRQIDGQAFRECSSLTSIVIPKSVTSISYTSFERCDALTSIVVDKENTIYDSRENSNAIIITETNELVVGCSTTVIPNTVTTIGRSAFRWQTGLTSISIPNSVKIIAPAAFELTSLTSVTIPNSVDSIGSSAFYSCKALVKVISEIQKPFNINKNVFSSINKDAVLYVPEGTKALYEAAEGWKEFKTIKEMGLEPVDEGDNVDYGNESDITEETNLDGLVVNNMFYSIGAEAGGYDAEEGCIIITKETSDEQMELIKDLGITDEELNENFTGIIFKVPAGRGTVTVNAEAEGNMTLKVKVGDGQTVEMELEGKLKMKFPYNVNEESLVYIFAGTTEQNNARRGLKAQEIPTPCLKIYGIEWENRTIAGDANGDGVVDEKDILEIVNFLMGKPSEKFNKIAADANGDNVVNAADIVTIVDILKKE